MYKGRGRESNTAFEIKEAALNIHIIQCCCRARRTCSSSFVPTTPLISVSVQYAPFLCHFGRSWSLVNHPAAIYFLWLYWSSIAFLSRLLFLLQINATLRNKRRSARYVLPKSSSSSRCSFYLLLDKETRHSFDLEKAVIEPRAPYRGDAYA